MKSIKIYTLLLALLLAGCVTSRITYSWKKPGSISKHYEKIMVLGLIGNSDRSLQAQMEDHMVGDLRKLGYNAVSSLEEFGSKAFDGMNEQAAIAKLKNKKIAAVVTIVLLNKHRERTYVPERVYFPRIHENGRFWDYRMGIARVYEPGYFVVSTRYFWESNLYEMDNQGLVFSVQTESFNPDNSQSLAHEYGQIIIKQMLDMQVLER